MGLRRRLHGVSLRTRLVAAMVGLLAVVCLVIGLTTVFALRGFLVDRLDEQLSAAGNRSSSAYGSPGSDPEAGAHGGNGSNGANGGPDFLFAPGQGEGTLGVRLVDDRVVQAAVLDSTGTAHTLQANAQRALSVVAVDGQPHTVHLDTLGDYRVLATRAPDGDVIVTGLPMSGVESTLRQLVGVIALVALLGLVAAAVAGTAIVRLALRPLRRVAATAREVAATPLASGDVALRVRVAAPDTDPRTEVGQVGASLNAMLGHVDAALTARHASETKVRRFVADASHELRTPLAAIRGYAELTRRSHETISPDVAHALSRIESAADRMTGLVEDLLTLARLDSGRELARDPVDLVELAAACAADASAAGPDHRWQLDLPATPVVVLGDADRLHQVVANLLANARTHTPAGTRVMVAVRCDASTAVLTVTDSGPGIDPAVVPVLFERFTRGDSSRSRASGSTGLGLSIVDAVVNASGGTISVDSRPGRTTFELRMAAFDGMDEPPPLTDDSVPSHKHLSAAVTRLGSTDER